MLIFGKRRRTGNGVGSDVPVPLRVISTAVVNEKNDAGDDKSKHSDCYTKTSLHEASPPAFRIPRPLLMICLIIEPARLCMMLLIRVVLSGRNHFVFFGLSGNCCAYTVWIRPGRRRKAGKYNFLSDGVQLMATLGMLHVRCVAWGLCRSTSRGISR